MDAGMIAKMKLLFDNYCSMTSTISDDDAKCKLLDIKHLDSMLPLFGFFLKEKEMEGLQKKIRNLYSTSAISFETLLRALLLEMDASKDDEIIKQCFRECDRNKDNRLDIDDLEQMMQDLNIDAFNKGQTRHLLHFINGDKHRDFVTLRDFRRMMRMDLKLFQSTEFKYEDKWNNEVRDIDLKSTKESKPPHTPRPRKSGKKLARNASQPAIKRASTLHGNRQRTKSAL